MNSIDSLILGINKFIEDDVQYNSYEFLAWYSDVDAFLEKEYGKTSLAYKEFKDIKFATCMKMLTAPWLTRRRVRMDL